MQSDVENEDEETNEDLIDRTQIVMNHIINASNEEDDEENDNDSIS